MQPTANCGSASAGTSTASAFWVGLGGNSETSNALEQIGTEVDCSAAGQPRYLAWYELVPALSKPIKLVVTPGDRINASVTVAGTQVTVGMRNLTRKTTFSRVLHMAAPDTTSAEWIAEAPSACTTSGTNCRQAPLTNFGTVRFSQSSLTDSNGHTGTISDPAWSPTALTLQSDIAGPTFGRYRTPRHARPRHAERSRRRRRRLHRQVEHRNRRHDRPRLPVRRLRVRLRRLSPPAIFLARSTNFASAALADIAELGLLSRLHRAGARVGRSCF